MKTKTKIALIVATFFWFTFSEPAHAYIDPATTTYVIQIISALVITLGVTIGIFFSKLRLSLINLRVRLAELTIRLFSRKKSVGPDAAVTYYPRTNRHYVEPTGKWRGLWQEDRLFRQRFRLSFLIGATFSFTFIFFGVYELFSLNRDSFMFPFSSICKTFALVTVACAAVIILLLTCLKGRVFDWFVSLCFGLIFAGYIQGNFLNSLLGELSGDRIVWDSLRKDMIINILIWFVLISLPFIFRYLNRKVWTQLIQALCCLLILAQIISLITLFFRNKASGKADSSYVSVQGMYDAPIKHNIVVIVLDRLDNRYIQKVLSENPRFFDQLDGFTHFTNNLSLYSRTFPSVASMFSGQNYFYDEPKSDYLKKAWTTSDFLPSLRKKNYGVHLYMEAGYTYDQASDLLGIADNIATDAVKVEQDGALKQFMLLSAFRYTPLSMKPFFWTSTDQFNKLISIEKGLLPYVTDDLLYYRNLVHQKLSPSGNENLFTYLHLNGPHAPYVMNEFAQEVPPEKSDSITQTKGSFHIVYEYLNQLKALGLYESSTIIITGDHGARKDDYYPLDRAIVTGLFVKPAGSANQPLATSHAPVSADNFRPFIYQQAGLPHAAFGKTYFEIAEDEQVTRYLYHQLIKSDTQPERLLTYEIKGDANDFSNWRLIKEKIINQ